MLAVIHFRARCDSKRGRWWFNRLLKSAFKIQFRLYRPFHSGSRGDFMPVFSVPQKRTEACY